MESNRNASNRNVSISATAIRQHIATLVLTVAVVVIGTFFVNRLQVDLLPEITYPRVRVEVRAPGVDPEVAVDQITRPLEEVVSATEGVEQIYSRTTEGSSRVDLFFRPGGDIDRALNDAVAAFNRGRNSLPDDIEDVRVFKFDPSQLPIYEFALTSSSLSDLDLRVFADQEIAKELTLVPGVAVADVVGGIEEEVQVNLDPARLQAVGASTRDVLDTLRDRNQDVAGGRITGSQAEPLVRTIGQFRTAAELQTLTLEVGSANTTQPATRVYLQDVAEVTDGTAEQRIFVRLNGETAVKVTIQKQPGANSLVVIDDIKKTLADLKQQGVIQEDMTIVETLDESRFIRNAVSNVVIAGVSGSILAGLSVLLFLGSLRQTLVIMLAIPLSTMVAVILMAAFGLSLNIFSLGGLALGVGIVVDNSIVMLETIVEGVRKTAIATGSTQPHHLSEADILDNAEASSQQIESALVAATSTNLVAVLPFLMLGGLVSLLFNELILTISFAVAASILVAITVVPALTSRLLNINWSSRVGDSWLLSTFNRRFHAATVSYSRTLGWFLQHRIIVILGAFLVLGSSSWVIAGQLPQQPVPRVSTGQADLIVQFPPGTNLETNRQVMAATDKILMSFPETEYVFTVAGGSLFGSNTQGNVLRSSTNITLKPGTNVDRFIGKANQAMRKLNLVGTRLRFRPGRVRGIILSNSPSIGSDVDVTLVGQDAAALDQAGQQVLRALDQGVDSVQFRPDSDPDQPEVQVQPDWERLSELGLSAIEVGETIETAINGIVPTRLQREERLVDVRVRFPRQTITAPSQLQDIPLFVVNNQPVQLGDVAKIATGQAPGEIQRLNQRRIFQIVGNLAEKASLSQAQSDIEATLATVELPNGVRLLPSTARETNQALINSLGLLGGLAAFLVFVVMAVQYNSLVDPLVIMVTVPLALAGGIFGLAVTGQAVSIIVLVGVVLLIGIVVNNAIIMVELANQIRVEERTTHQIAILKAAPQRLRPILMTTITTVLGMFPLALGLGEGSEFLQPLGIVVFAGLALATVLTLFLIPCIYVLFHSNMAMIPKHLRSLLST